MNLSDKIKEKLLKTFKIEANDHINFISNNLIEYEKEKDLFRKKELIEEIFRAAHSLKGAARAVGLSIIVGLTQSIENIFSGLKKNQLTTNPELYDNVLRSVNLVADYVNEPDEAKRNSMKGEIDKYTLLIEDVFIANYRENPEENETKKVIKEDKAGTGSSAAETQKAAGRKTKSKSPPQGSSRKKIKTEPAGREMKKTPTVAPSNESRINLTDQIRISVSKIENILNQSEELLSNKQSLMQQAHELNSMLLLFEIWRKKWGKNRIQFSKLFNYYSLEKDEIKYSKELSDLLNFMEYNEEFLTDVEALLGDLYQGIRKNSLDFTNKLFTLSEDIRSSLLFPMKTLTDQFPLMVRDIARELGKEINFKVEGDSIEIDKRVLEELKDPFVHLIRNSIDHGIETPEERIKKHKNRVGTILLRIRTVEGNKAEIVISDDGKGLDPDEIRESAVRKNIRTKDELSSLSEKDIFNLIFESDFSTAKVITDLSGRGLGMAIVRQKVNKLDGSIEINSEKDFGTVIKLVLPLSVSTVRGLLLKAGAHKYFVKTSELIAALRIDKSELHNVENKFTVNFRGKHIGLVELSGLLGIMPNKKGKFLKMIICRSGDAELGLIVDDIIGEQEILVKSFNEQIKRLKYFEAASISTRGEVIPILNIDDIFKSASAGFGREISSETPETEIEKKNILVVDDSITSRLLLKDILESSGYHVATSVDGREAWSKVRQEIFDLVVTDIEMPRMNGFELTAQIKSSKKYSAIPVVLVSALSKREDMERGIDAGADAYIIKSDFKQSNLLETIRRLIV